MRSPLSGTAGVLLAGLLFASCSASPSPETEACTDAAAVQALAEAAFGEAVEQSQVGHSDAATAEQEHDRLHDLIVAARIDVIVAEAGTRQHCG